MKQIHEESLYVILTAYYRMTKLQTLLLPGMKRCGFFNLISGL